MPPLVSVIIPTYRHRDFVQQTLASVFVQTFTDYEVIVVNDGSPDDTAEVLRPYAADGRIRYIEQPNAGQAAARNRGLASATGTFIAFLDDDDTWPPDKLQWQTDHLHSHPDCGLVYGSVHLIGTVDFVLPDPGTCPKTDFESMFNGSPLVSPGQALIRRGVLDAVGGFDAGVWGADDFDLYFKLARTTTLCFDQRPSLVYRRHAGNASNDAWRLYSNCARVLQRHLAYAPPPRVRWLARRADRFLFSYFGRQLRQEAARRWLRASPMTALPRTAAYLRLAIVTAPSILGDRFARWKNACSDEIMDPQIEISIILCTQNRAAFLSETLQSLARVDTTAHRSELIVVDNNSSDGTAAVIQACVERLRPKLSVRTANQPTGGKAAALNAGLAMATGTVILLTDDDVRFPTDWVAGMADPILRGSADVVAGGVLMAAHLNRDWMTPLHRAWLADTDQIDPMIGDVVGANMAFGRHVLAQVSGFDERLGPGALGYREDTLFGQQLFRAGFRFIDGRDVAVEHHFDPDRLSRDSFVKAAGRHGRSLAYFARTYEHWHLSFPALRRAKHVVKTLLSRRASASIDAVPDEAELHQISSTAFWEQYFLELKQGPRESGRRTAAC